MLRRRPRQAVTLDGRLSFTGRGFGLLVMADEALVLTPDTLYAGSDEADSPTLDRIAETLSQRGRFSDLGEALLCRDDAPEAVPVTVTIQPRR